MSQKAQIHASTKY